MRALAFLFSTCQPCGDLVTSRSKWEHKRTFQPWCRLSSDWQILLSCSSILCCHDQKLSSCFQVLLEDPPVIVQKSLLGHQHGRNIYFLFLIQDSVTLIAAALQELFVLLVVFVFFKHNPVGGSVVNGMTLVDASSCTERLCIDFFFIYCW